MSFTDPAALPPAIMKYPVALDGTLGAGTPFANVPPNDSSADGLAMDSKGNVYVAVKNGVDVFKPDGLSLWGHITTTKIDQRHRLRRRRQEDALHDERHGDVTVVVKSPARSSNQRDLMKVHVAFGALAQRVWPMPGISQ